MSLPFPGFRNLPLSAQRLLLAFLTPGPCLSQSLFLLLSPPASALLWDPVPSPQVHAVL